MKKLYFSLTAVFVLNILPLLLKPYLLLHYKTLILIVGSLLIWLTQPAFSISETNANKKTDRFTILIILLAASISLLSLNIEWAYWRVNTNSNIFFSITGFFMIFSGIFIRVYAIKTLGDDFTATVHVSDKQRLIQSGPYAIIRHPSYLGAYLSIVGGAVFLNAYISICIAAILMFIAYYIRITTEEKTLDIFFGDEYREYSKKVKKLFPYIW